MTEEAEKNAKEEEAAKRRKAQEDAAKKRAEKEEDAAKKKTEEVGKKKTYIEWSICGYA